MNYMSHLALNSKNTGVVSFPAFIPKRFLRPSLNFDQLYDSAVGTWKVPSVRQTSSVDTIDSKLAYAVATKERLRAGVVWDEYSKGVLFKPMAACEVEEIGRTVNHVMAVIECLGPKAINLTAVEAKTLQPDHMLAVLRSTFLYRDDVLGWTYALGELKVALQAAGHEPQEVVVGLE